MIALALLLILLITALALAAVKSKRAIKRIAIAVLAVILTTPIVLIALVKPAQAGLIFPEFGKITLLFSEPEDLRIPLATEVIDTQKLNYEFNITHKYVGNYDVEILFSDREIDPWEISKDDLDLTITFYSDSKKLLSKESSFIGGFIGARGNGLTYITYSLPDELPINKQLKATLEIKGNLQGFITKYGASEIQILKGSDL